MSEPKWTPGSWNWVWVSAPASGGGHLYLIDDTGRKIAAFWGKAEEKEANAPLIAAAPEMYAALATMLDAYDHAETPSGAEWDAARRATAKARGAVEP